MQVFSLRAYKIQFYHEQNITNVSCRCLASCGTKYLNFSDKLSYEFEVLSPFPAALRNSGVL